MAVKTPEAKSSKILRQVLSFVLFIMIVLLVFSSAIKSTAINKIKIENAFLSDTYISGLKDNITDYTQDVYIRNGISTDNTENIFKYDTIKDSVKAYIAANLHSSIGYDENTYNVAVRSVTSLFKNDLKNKVKNNDTAINEMCVSFEKYYRQQVELGAIGYIEKAVNIGSIASVIICVISSFFAVASALILFFIGNKRYRNVRAIGNSLMTAGVFNMLLSLMSVIIFKIKHFDLYPLYLSDIFMAHFHSFLSVILMTSGIIIVLAMVLYAIVWKMKKG